MSSRLVLGLKGVRRGSPPGRAPYHTVIWFTGQDLTDTLETGDQAALTGFLEQGGKLFLSSQHYIPIVLKES